jgi:hypothetical protein
MRKSIVSLIYVAICIFIESKLKLEFCKSFLKDLLSDNVDNKQLSIMGDNGKILMNFANDFKGSGVSFDEQQKDIIINHLAKDVYASMYYMEQSVNKSLSYQDRQKAKDISIIREALCICLKEFLEDSSRDAEIKATYNSFKWDFESYKINTQLIIDMITNNPSDNEGIREAIKERIKEAKKLIEKYGERYRIGDFTLRSVLEDDIIENKRKEHLSELDKSVVDLIA